MEGGLRPLGIQDPGDFTDEAVAGLREASGAGVDPLLLGYHPIARLNPFHALLYQQAYDEGVATVPIIQEDTIRELAELARVGQTTALHLHWLNRVLADARTPTEARRNMEGFLRRLDEYRDVGGRLVWTVHNIVPHGATFEDEEARLSQEVVDRCDVVHVMADDTLEIVAPWFRVPTEKVLRVVHPSYLGAYEDTMTRARARHELGVPPDELVFVVLGAIRPYKGLGELLDAWEALPADGAPRRLVIAGGASDEPGIDEILTRAAVHPTVLLHAGLVEPSDIQVYLRAADVAVLPYVRTLNSGALLLALTFGVPVIVPDGGLAGAVDPAFALTFSHDDPADLGRVLLEANRLATPAAIAAARAAAERVAPGPLSSTFARGVRARLGLDLAGGAGAGTTGVGDTASAGRKRSSRPPDAAGARAVESRPEPDVPVSPR
jgi:beta-1,4-mannosyltransferase